MAKNANEKITKRKGNDATKRIKSAHKEKTIEIRNMRQRMEKRRKQEKRKTNK